ncbi:hypothetical protein HN51_024646 [Arachis hypogaea]
MRLWVRITKLLSQGVGSACAILSSKVDSQNEDSNSAAAGENIAAVNGHKSAVTDLNLVHVSGKKTLPPKSLTISDLSPASMHGSQVRVAYQGVPGAYSEAAVGKVYPNGEAIACDQFEVAFQAIELWIADRTILSIKNSFGGCVLRVGNTQLLYEIAKKIQQKHVFLFWLFLANRCAKHQNGVSVRIILLCTESVPFTVITTPIYVKLRAKYKATAHSWPHKYAIVPPAAGHTSMPS